MVVINMDATGKNIRARIKESGFKMKDIAE